MEFKYSDEIKEKIKAVDESKLFTEVRKEAEKIFGRDFFQQTHHILLVIIKDFIAKNYSNKLLASLFMLNGRASNLVTFMTENELILSDELKRRCKEKFIEIYKETYKVLNKFLELKEKEGKNNVQEKK